METKSPLEVLTPEDVVFMFTLNDCQRRQSSHRGLSPLADMALTNVDIIEDLYASDIRKNQDHPYLYGVKGLEV